MVGAAVMGVAREVSRNRTWHLTLGVISLSTESPPRDPGFSDLLTPTAPLLRSALFLDTIVFDPPHCISRNNTANVATAPRLTMQNASRLVKRYARRQVRVRSKGGAKGNGD